MKKHIVVTLALALFSVNAFCLPAFSLENMEGISKKLGAQLENQKQKQAAKESTEEYIGVFVKNCGIKDFSGKKSVTYSNITFTPVYNEATQGYTIIWSAPQSKNYDSIIVKSDVEAVDYHTFNLNAFITFNKKGKKVDYSAVTVTSISKDEYSKYFAQYDEQSGSFYGTLAKDTALKSVPAIYKNGQLEVRFSLNDKADVSYDILKNEAFDNQEVTLGVQKMQDPHRVKVTANVKLFKDAQLVQDETIVLGEINDQNFYEKSAYKNLQEKDNYSLTPAEPCGVCPSCKTGDKMHCRNN